MAEHGLWKKEIKAGKLKFIGGLSVLLLTAISIPLLYEFTLKLMNNAVAPDFAKGQVELFKDFRYWIWSQWYGKNLSQIGAIVAVVFGAGIISAEVSRKTIHFVLTKPLTRKYVFAVKYVVNLCNFILVTVLATIGLYITLVAAGRAYPIGQMVLQTVVAVTGLSVVFSMAVFFSAVFDQTIKSVVVSIITAFALMLPGFTPGLAAYSLFYQIAGVGIFEGRGFPFAAVGVFIVLSTVFYFLGLRRFVKRDL